MEFAGMKFNKAKATTLDNRTVVSFTEDSGQPFPFTIKCSSSGMTFEGNMSKEIVTHSDLQAFAKAVAEAWSEHQKLAPKIVSSLAGH